MSAVPFPSTDQVRAIPHTHDGRVAPQFIDANGHMNVRHYLDAGAMSADRALRDIGVDDEYRERRRLGVFTVEHHIRYLGEMHEGDLFTAHPLVLERSDKAAHFLSFILNQTGDWLAATLEIVTVHVSLDTRRPTPYPDDIAAGFDKWIARRDDVTWQVPVSGSMGVRRKA
ncbi:thioesterase [Nocardioides seonyuensis]|uniref:Thioesterase n=1 Tax=Nocardioides seonyuensis TaxID=2518371 RepID=A0A4P7IJA5_9ACTN|nr:thioesterase family protein [Nocardioides seonyuensis]QBX55961.1 thioesterase [Nocardioides seonyuensis]